MDIARQYAEYAKNLDYNDLPEEVILHVKKAVLDIMGNDIGGYEWMESGPSIIDGIRIINRGNGGATCLLYTSPSPRDQRGARMPSSA